MRFSDLHSAGRNYLAFTCRWSLPLSLAGSHQRHSSWHHCAEKPKCKHSHLNAAAILRKRIIHNTRNFTGMKVQYSKYSVRALRGPSDCVCTFFDMRQWLFPMKREPVQGEFAHETTLGIPKKAPFWRLLVGTRGWAWGRPANWRVDQWQPERPLTGLCAPYLITALMI